MEEVSEATSSPGKLGIAKLACWASPAGALAALGLPLAMFLPNYYIENLGVSPVAAGLVFLLLRLWDGVTDPAIGAISDRVQPPLGRRKFWLALAAPILVASVWMVMVPPSDAGAFYLAGWLMVLYIGLTALQVNQIAWGAELAPEYDARSRLMGWYEVFVVAGLLILLVIAASLEIGTPSDQVQAGRGDTLHALALFLVIALPATILLALIFVPEGEHHEHADVSPKAMWAAFRSSASLQNILAVNCLYRFATGVTGTLFLWYADLKLDLGSFAAPTMALYFLSGLLGMPLLMRLTAKTSKKRSYLIALFVGAALSLPLGLLDGRGTVAVEGFNPQQILGIGFICLSGLLYGAGPYLARAMIADASDEAHLNSGSNRHGLFFALLSFSEKLGFALAVGASTALLTVIGLETGPDANPSADAIWRLGLLFAILPAIAMFAAAWVLRSYSISRARHDEIRRLLTEKGLVSS